MQAGYRAFRVHVERSVATKDLAIEMGVASTRVQVVFNNHIIIGGHC